MRVLVFGSRTFDDRAMVSTVLQGVYELHTLGFLTLYVDEITVIAGEAKGADTLAKEWAIVPGPHPAAEDPDNRNICHVYYEGFPAAWEQHGHRAGPIRNTRMLKALLAGDPNETRMGIGFVDKPIASSLGSYNMLSQLKRAGIPTYVMEKHK